ncbi:cobalamin biosynthesis protein [Pseudonocardia sp. N23]|uniref:cobalamin biosynthesis protein n=1 Tax=Pseudonocardia sp. N23 TaxID=1987376 RepID=UPI00209BC929|nr:cobalamin biosynthesis protein [Pseudonocardia sp. N23]
MPAVGLLVVGLGASRGVTAAAVADLVARVLGGAGDVAAHASIDRRADEPGLLAAIAPAPLRTYPAAALDAVAVPSPSDRTRESVGAGSVAEAAALLAATELAGPGDEVVLRVAKTRGERCTAAVAEVRPRRPTPG